MSGSEGGGKGDGKGEENRAVAVQQDPKNVAELTNYIQNMLQQMQDRCLSQEVPFSGLHSVSLQVPDHVRPDNLEN